MGPLTWMLSVEALRFRLLFTPLWVLTATTSDEKRTSILRPSFACAIASTDCPGGLCDRPTKWGLGRTLASTDRDATAG